MVSLIRNKELKQWKRTGPWTLVYGRRKTGKSFFVKNFTAWDHYFFVGRAGEILEGDQLLSYETFTRISLDALRAGKHVVVDEIQRLPPEFHDRLQALGVTGRLTAVSSTLWLARRLIAEKSPLLGLFTEFPVGLVDEKDILEHLSPHVKDPKLLAELATYLREPWLLPLWDEVREGCLFTMATATRMTVPALIGEVFSEEQRQLSTTYEAILQAVSDGKRISGEIASALFSHRAIRADNPSLVHPYLESLCRLGILEKVKVFGKSRYAYEHCSPVIDLYYYLQQKYGFGDRDLPDRQVERVLGEKMPQHVERFFASLLSKMLGLGKERIVERDHEVDIALTDFQRLAFVGEVKWSSRITEADIRRAEEVLGRYDCTRALIVPDRHALPREPRGIEVWDMKALLGKLRGRTTKGRDKTAR